MRAAGWTIDQAIMDDKRHIKSAALGMNQAYFILYTDGGYRYACNVNYPDLAAILSKCERGDVVVRILLLALRRIRSNTRLCL